MSDKIMPCPHCGKRDPVVDNYQQSARVVCIGCGTTGPLKMPNAAIRAWNRMALAVQIAEAAWLERETTSAAHLCRWSSIIVRPGPALDPASSGLAQKLGELLDAWGEDGQGDAS